MNSEKFIEFWNRVYYAAYSIHYFISCYIFGPIMMNMIVHPLYSFMNLFPALKRRNERKGITPETIKQTTEEVYDNPSSGHLMYFVNGFFSLVQALPILLCISILEYYLGGSIRNWMFNNLALNLIVIWGLGLLLQYFFAWKNDRYLTYFAKFGKESRRKRVLWSIGLLIVFIVLLLATVYIFIEAEKRHGFWKN